LVRALDDNFFPVPWAVLEGLGRLRDERAIEPIVSLLKAKKHRSQAVQALSSFGESAEHAALELLAAPDSDVRFDACQVLKAVGGLKSVDSLAIVARDDENGIVRLVAGQAVKEIRRRNQ
jgi:hypothetical protein